MIDTNTSVMSFIYYVRRQRTRFLVRIFRMDALLRVLLLLHGFQVDLNYLRLYQCWCFICFWQSSSFQRNSIFKCLPFIFHTLAPRFSCLHLEHFRSKASMLPHVTIVQHSGNVFMCISYFFLRWYNLYENQASVGLKIGGEMKGWKINFNT